ncbi:MAG: hypothetical protein QME12_06210 [Nanoarchaeota archaeon]|nr:hypothetical protein [Nanoarchaeota archaeon]
MNFKRLEAKLDADNFFGQAQINQMGVTMEYFPGRYKFVSVPVLMGGRGISSTLIKFTAPYAITEIRTGTVTSQRKLSSMEMKAVENSGSLANYLWADPRYVFKFATDIQKMTKNSFLVRIYDKHAMRRAKRALDENLWDSAEPFVITAEMQFKNNLITKMKIREAMKEGFITDEREIRFYR